jgi:predicted permease
MEELARSVGRDLRQGIRLWWSCPGVSLVALCSLMISIGAATAVFTFFDVLLLRPLPVRAPEELYAVGPATPANLDLVPLYVSYPFYKQLRENPMFAQLIASSTALSSGVNLTADGSAERVRAELVSGNYFSVLGVSAAIGRVLSDDDDRVLGAHPLVVLSRAAWRRSFGARADVVGQTIQLNGHPYTIIGVMPEGFFGTRVGFTPDLWAPLSMTEQMSGGTTPSRQSNYIELNLRLSPDEMIVAREEALTSAFRRWTAPNATSPARGSGALPALRLSLSSGGLSLLRAQYRQPLLILLGAVGVLLLIACANVGSLLLARGIARQREMAIRLSQGATPHRIVRQLFTECLLLALAGGGLGWCISLALGRTLLWFLPTTVSGWQFSPSLRAFFFTAAVVAFASVVLGLIPSRLVVRRDIYQSLGRSTVDRLGSLRRIDGQSVLSIVQVALSLVLVVASLLFARSLHNLRSVETGFQRSNVLLAGLDPVKSGYTEERTRIFFDAFRRALAEQPGVRAVGLASYGSLSGVLAAGTRFTNTSMHAAGQDLQPADDATVWLNIVTPGYFDAVALPLRRGRDFRSDDTTERAGVAIISETAARYFFGAADPIGRRIGSGRTGSADTEIVGVVADAKYLDLREAPRRVVYRPHAQAFRSLMTLHLASDRPLEALLPVVLREAHALDPSIPVFQVQTMRGRMDDSLRQERLVAALAGGLSVFGALLAALGLYGVVNYAVARRTRELAVRLALGALPRDVFSAVLQRTLRLALVGIALGVPAALACTRLLGSFLFGVTGSDPLTLLLAAAGLALLALAAGYLPARRAVRVDPLTALRHE